MKRTKFFILMLILISCMVSCSMFTPNNGNFYGGKILDNKAMAELHKEFMESESIAQIESQSINNIESESNSNQEEKITETNPNSPNDPETVYWSKSGKVWHLYNDCGYLKKANEIFSGTINQAKANGAQKLCSSCSKKAEN